MFFYLLVFLSVIQVTFQSPKQYHGLDIKLNIPRNLNKAEMEKIFVGGMMDKHNEEKLEHFKKLRNLRRTGTGVGTRGMQALGLSRKDVLFWLYRQSDKSKYYNLKIEDAENLKEAPLDKNLETKIIIHGWMNSGDSWFPSLIKDTLLASKDMNLIVVDWSSASYGFIYPWTAGYVPEVGGIVGDVVSQLISQGYVDISTIHFIGHSLGAHVSGFAGKTIYKKLGERIPWITGLDPARPCFYTKPATDRLDKSDGDFVDIVHTCGDYLGVFQPIGHIDFYPNGGSLVQPGCSYYDVGTCSHARSFQYYAEAMVTNNSFIGFPCNDLLEFTSGKCNNVKDAKKMGRKYPGDSYGKMILMTHTSSPWHIEPDENSQENNTA